MLSAVSQTEKDKYYVAFLWILKKPDSEKQSRMMAARGRGGEGDGERLVKGYKLLARRGISSGYLNKARKEGGKNGPMR